MSRKVGKPALAVLQAIIDHKMAHDGTSPSVRDLAAATGAASTASVAYHLDTLEMAGLIEREFSLPRIIRVVGGQWRYCPPA